jgi:hypothetical protein
LNHLDPNLNKASWTPEEDKYIIQTRLESGNQWALMSKHLTGRTANAIKNRWNSTLKKKLDSYTLSTEEKSKKRKISRDIEIPVEKKQFKIDLVDSSVDEFIKNIDLSSLKYDSFSPNFIGSWSPSIMGTPSPHITTFSEIMKNTKFDEIMQQGKMNREDINP